MSIFRAAGLCCLVMVLIACAPKQSTGQSPPVRSPSRWNLLAYGGKGEMHGAPVCHPLGYFTKLPKRLDIDSDLYDAEPVDLTDNVTVTLLGRIKGRRIYEILHLVGVPGDDANLQLPMKILLVERHHAEFCDIYQLQYVNRATAETHEARILTIDGRGVLKSLDQDNHTWWENYWVINKLGPLLLSIRPVETAISKVTPEGAAQVLGWLNLKSESLQVHVSSSDGTPLGAAVLDLSVRGSELIARNTRWIPEVSGR